MRTNGFVGQLNRIRRLGAGSGVVLVLALAVVPEGSVAARLALLALVLLGFATATGWLQLVSQGRLRQPVGIVKSRGSRAWLFVTIAVVLMAGLAVQSWFQPGTTIAGGDLAPPDGTAWIGRLFEPWTWGGSTLGEPSQLPLALPWAAILRLVHAFGGDPGLAQRIWDTTLFVGAGLGALGLLASLRMGPVAALAGTAVYLLNPYVVSVVNTYDVNLAALCLLAAIPAALVAAGTGRLSVRWSAALVASTAPLVGYAFYSPPLVGMILAAMLAAPLAVAWVDGRDAAFRSLRALLLAVPLLVAASAYWIVPEILHLAAIIPSQLASLSDWTWTETRTTIRNAFWLNNNWAWNYPEYFPYAKAYELLPLSVVRFVLPAIAFCALALAPSPRSGDRSFRREQQLRLIVAAATVALVVLVFSTGTNPPGSTIFDPLYNLPVGWLLREPARFLMLEALAYAVMIAIVVEALLEHPSIVELVTSRRLTVPALRLSIAPLAFGTALLVGFPLYTGVVVPDTKPTLPRDFVHARPAHVQMPAYWPEMAGYADALSIQGALLVLPPDDFYEMPYTWYYGSDSFVVELFKRHVLLPTTQGYTPASSELIGAANLTAQSILNRDWRQVEALVTVLNAPLILVRRDIQTPYPGRSIVPPNDLAVALSAAPNFALLRQVGSLDLFALRKPISETEVGPHFMTINTQTPDLRLLSLLPPNTALVSGRARAGIPNVVQAPGLERWQAQGTTLVWQPPSPAGRAYQIADLGSQTMVSLDRAGTFTAASSKAQVTYNPDAPANAVNVSLTGRSAISNGDFANGLWRPVYDCHPASPTQAKLEARILAKTAPGGVPTLQLSASLDSACEYQALDWHGGPLTLSVMINHLQGAAARLCLWEIGPETCAALPSIPNTNGWVTYRASVSPDTGTTGLTLYLYADANEPAGRTINDYADVRLVELPDLPSLALLADLGAEPAATAELVVVHSSFSTEWQGSIEGEHALVDGMLNGWLIRPGSDAFSVHYKPAGAFLAAEWLSLVALFVIAFLPLSSWIGRVASRRVGSWKSQR
jgi:hypothetical protein